MEENRIHIPDGWKSYVGNEILKVQGGYAFKSNDYKDEGILLVRIGNVGNGNFVFKDVIYVPKRFQITHSNFQLWKGDVLMGLTGDLGKICILKDGDFPYFLNQRVGRFIPTEKIDNEYLYYLVSSSFVQSKFDAFFAGGAQKNISPKQIESIDYVIPKSTPEQTTIARILSNVDEAISQTEQLIAKYIRIKTGLMQDLLTKGIDEHGNIRSEETHEFKDSPLGRIPVEWESCKLENIIKLQRGFDITTKDLSPGIIPIVSSSGITGYHNKYMAIGPGVITGRKGTIGKVYFVKSNYWPHDTTLWVKDFKNNDPFFIYFLLESINLNQFEASTANPTLNRNAVHPHLIIYPSSYDEQKIIATKIDSFNNLISDYINSSEKLKVLKMGLMQDLLSGKVRVNHIIKETSSV